jgi:hypothetical protein
MFFFLMELLFASFRVFRGQVFKFFTPNPPLRANDLRGSRPPSVAAATSDATSQIPKERRPANGFATLNRRNV